MIVLTQSPLAVTQGVRITTVLVALLMAKLLVMLLEVSKVGGVS